MTQLDSRLPTVLFFAVSHAQLFTFHRESISFETARQRCKGKDMDLAVVRNAEDQFKLNSAMGRSPIAWIGLRADTESWRWSEANVVVKPQPRSSESAGVQFTNWDSGKPRDISYQSCTAVKSDGKWVDDYCMSQHKFICYQGKV